MLNVTVQSTETGEKAFFSVEVENEEEAISQLKRLSIVHGLYNLAQFLMRR